MSNRFICVPITETKVEPFLAATQAANTAADAIELRVDYLPAADHASLLEQILRLQASGGITKPIVLTHRPQEQGGQRAIAFNERVAFWQNFNAWDAIAFADMEFDLVRHLAQAQTTIQWHKVICSWHNFETTPDDLIARYDAMAATPAAIVKLATKCNRITDTQQLFALFNHARGKKPVIALGMGLPGLATRVLALAQGGLLTFAALRAGAESASGQPTIDELKNLYRAHQLTRASQIFGVIGNPVGHSRSPRLHNPALQAAKVDGVYLPLEVNDIGSFIADFVHPKTKKIDWNLRGLSVTIPHKISIIPLLDHLDETAKAIGAVNTVVVRGNELHGYNTDVTGAMNALAPLFDICQARVAVLGAGGSARAICYGLKERQANITIFARDLAKAQPLADEFGASVARLDQFTGQAEVVINCTPIGMHGHSEGQSPVAASALQNVKLVYDLIYTPMETALLQMARAQGCQTLGGLAMLVNQAGEQFRLFTGKEAPLEVMWQQAKQ